MQRLFRNFVTAAPYGGKRFVCAERAYQQLEPHLDRLKLAEWLINNGVDVTKVKKVPTRIKQKLLLEVPSNLDMVRWYADPKQRKGLQQHFVNDKHELWPYLLHIDWNGYTPLYTLLMKKKKIPQYYANKAVEFCGPKELLRLPAEVLENCTSETLKKTLERIKKTVGPEKFAKMMEQLPLDLHKLGKLKNKKTRGVIEVHPAVMKNYSMSELRIPVVEWINMIQTMGTDLTQHLPTDYKEVLKRMRFIKVLSG